MEAGVHGSFTHGTGLPRPPACAPSGSLGFRYTVRSSPSARAVPLACGLWPVVPYSLRTP